MGVSDEKDDAELYTFGDDKSEEPMLIIEDTGSVATQKWPIHEGPGGAEEDADVDAEGEDASDEEKGDDQPFGWEYEQEV
jgi:transcription factor IIIB subunit 2